MDAAVVDGVLLSCDLMFQSKVTGTAAALGFRVACFGTLGEAFDETAKSARAVFLDLTLADISPTALIARLQHPRPRVVAFGPHVETAVLQDARDAGCEDVLPRSRFSAELPVLLQRVLTRESA